MAAWTKALLVGVLSSSGAYAFVPARSLPRGPAALPAFQLPTLELPDMSALFTGDSTPKGPRASDVFELFDGGVDADSVAKRCAPSVKWVDLDASTPAEGPEAVAKLMSAKYPLGATMVVDRVADGVRSSGATLYYDSEAGSGRRGTMYVETDEEGLITFVQEAWEPLYKPGR